MSPEDQRGTATDWPLTELIALLRKRYAEPPRPNCRICGEPLSIQAIGGGSVVWACAGSIWEDGKGIVGWKPGRRGVDQHYSDSRIEQWDRGDSDVLALCDRAESMTEAGAAAVGAALPKE